MSSNDAAGGASSPPITKSASYKPWEMPTLSASTQALLERLKSAGGLLAPKAPLSLGQIPSAGIPSAETLQYADMRNRVLESMKTSQNMEIEPIPSARKSVKNAAPNVKTAAPRSSVSGSRNSTPASATGQLAGGATSASASGKKGGSGRSKAKAGSKRKRSKDEDISEEESEAMSELGDDSSDNDDTPDFPSMTQSGRKVVKPSQFNPSAQDGPPPAKKKALPAVHYNKKMPKNIESALCKSCARGFSPATNMIVFCDGCNGGWHQMCHQPNVSDDVVKDETSPWFCSDCTAKKAARSNRGSTAATALPARSVAPVAVGHVTIKPKTVEVRRAKFSTMSHAHLVAFALHAIDLHPDLSIPPAPSPSAYQSNFQTQGAQRRTNIHPQQPFPPSATAAAGLFSRSEANPKAPINFIRKIQPGAAGSAPSSPYTTSFQHSSNNGNGYSGAVPSLRTGPQLQTSQEASSGPPPRAESAPAGVLGAPDIVMGGTEFANDDSNILIDGNRITAPSTAVEGNEEDESRESTPATPPYPKAGSGLMAKLKSDEEDLEWLVDGEAEEGRGYSHVFVDESGGVEGVTGDLGVA